MPTGKQTNLQALLILGFLAMEEDSDAYETVIQNLIDGDADFTSKDPAGVLSAAMRAVVKDPKVKLSADDMQAVRTAFVDLGVTEERLAIAINCID